MVYVAEADRPRLHAGLEQLKDSQTARRWEMSLQPRHDEVHPVAVQVAARRDALGRVRFLRWMIQDIAERQQVEAALRQSQKNDSLGILAGGVAHDFNNLLVTMLVQTSLALEQLPADSPVRPRLSHIMTAAEATTPLAQQMLVYSGHATVVMQPVDLTALIEHNHDLLDAALPPRAIRLVAGPSDRSATHPR